MKIYHVVLILLTSVTPFSVTAASENISNHHTPGTLTASQDNAQTREVLEHVDNNRTVIRLREQIAELEQNGHDATQQQLMLDRIIEQLDHASRLDEPEDKTILPIKNPVNYDAQFAHLSREQLEHRLETISAQADALESVGVESNAVKSEESWLKNRIAALTPPAPQQTNGGGAVAASNDSKPIEAGIQVSQECIQANTFMADICNRNVQTEACENAAKRKMQICDGVSALPVNRQESYIPSTGGVHQEFLGQIPHRSENTHSDTPNTTGAAPGQDYREGTVKQYLAQGGSLEKLRQSWKESYDKAVRACRPDSCPNPDAAERLLGDLKWLDGYITAQQQLHTNYDPLPPVHHSGAGSDSTDQPGLVTPVNTQDGVLTVTQ
jgi:hypothetical protein